MKVLIPLPDHTSENGSASSTLPSQPVPWPWTKPCQIAAASLSFIPGAEQRAHVLHRRGADLVREPDPLDLLLRLERARDREHGRRVVPVREGVEPAGGEGRRLADHPVGGLRPHRPLDADPAVLAGGLEGEVERSHRRGPRVVRVVAADVADVLRPRGARGVLGGRLEADQDGLALAREHAGVVALHPPEVRQVEDVVGSADDEGVEVALRHQRPDAIELGVVPLPAHSADHQRTRRAPARRAPPATRSTGFRSTPILSISASITSPGLR